jgi:hypothetical protein
MSQISSITSLVEDILNLQSSITPTLELIEQRKEALRAECAKRGNVGFVEAIAGKGHVEVRAASRPQLKGTEDVLNLEKWLDLPAPERVKLQALGVVTTEKVYSRASKAAVSVKLDPNEPAPIGVATLGAGDLAAHATLN